jgi:hypothetical protein
MPRQGHKLTILPVGNQLVATCECGNWCRTVRVCDNKPLPTVVAVLSGKHNRHLDRLGRPSAATNASNDSMPVLPEGDEPTDEPPKA